MHLPLNSLLQEAETIDRLDAPRYFPLESGRYEVKPGMVPFGTTFGNSLADQQVFQITKDFAHYRQVKLLGRTERLSKYYQIHSYSNEVASAIAQLMIDRLTQEHPHHFQVKHTGTEVILDCQLTGETVYLDTAYRLQQVQTLNSSISPPYASTLDALAAQIQEDLTVISRANQHHWISAIHLCYPNHWSAEEKIGKDFATVHAPVAGMESMNRRGAAIVHTMITRKPSVRFVWGFSTDTRLNHHPEPPLTLLANRWQGRQFNPQNPHLYLRIERQVTWGFPNVDAALFVIRTYFQNCCMLKQDPNLRSKLSSTIQSMTTEALAYKGLTESKAAILNWLHEE